MSEDKIVNGYYQSNIKTSRNEDSVYAMKYASQQMIIDKLQNNWNELKKWLQEKAIEKKEDEEISLQYFYVYKRMQELEGKSE